MAVPVLVILMELCLCYAKWAIKVLLSTGGWGVRHNVAKAYSTTLLPLHVGGMGKKSQEKF